MSNTKNKMQTQTSRALHNAIMKASGKDRPPMLAPSNYKAIDRLKQGESINVQDLETNLYCEFGKFTSQDGESLDLYYLRSQAATRNRGKEITNSPPPIYDSEPEQVIDDEASSKEKEINKIMALISMSFKKIYKPTNNNLRTSLNIRKINVDNTPRTIEELDKIEKLKDRVHKLEEENRILNEKSFKSAKIDTTAPVEDKESFKQGRMIVDIDEDVEVNLEEAQAKEYNLDLQHLEKVLSMQDIDEEKPVEVEKVLEVVTAAKLITKVVTTAKPTTTAAAQVPKASDPRRRRGVVIQDPEETVASVVVHTKVQPKDKEKGILIEEPKPLKGQVQIEQDKDFARQLKAKLNANINWNDVIEQVKRSERQNNAMMTYQALKRKPLTEAQARNNMMIYLKNMAGFKMNFFKGMTYSEIRPLFKKHYNSNQAFLERVEEEVTVQEKEIEEEEELKRHLQIMSNDDDDVYTKATPLASNVPVVDYQIHRENNKPYYKIIKADGSHKLFLSFITLLENFDREDLETLWKLVKETFETTELKNFSNDFLLNILKIMFEKPNIKANVWKDQKGIYGLAKVKSWKLFESCGVHIITLTTTQMFMLVEKKYPLIHFTLQQMLNNVRLEVEEESEMSLELLRLVKRQLNEGYVSE
uniref:Uncharacterized protein n=1 Tax=Tanacetum cinerariifolium TaxID=118510 RepID=A0A6L2MBT8_TANCI|nr:hypothetical protein [Tanacetum cinerariifolium]